MKNLSVLSVKAFALILISSNSYASGSFPAYNCTSTARIFEGSSVINHEAEIGLVGYQKDSTLIGQKTFIHEIGNSTFYVTVQASLGGHLENPGAEFFEIDYAVEQNQPPSLESGSSAMIQRTRGTKESSLPNQLGVRSEKRFEDNGNNVYFYLMCKKASDW